MYEDDLDSNQWEQLYNKYKTRLYPCPFCGKIEGLTLYWLDDQRVSISCFDCGAQGPPIHIGCYDWGPPNYDELQAGNMVMKEVIKEWNKRKTYN
jgi:hypothetical protein